MKARILNMHDVRARVEAFAESDGSPVRGSDQLLTLQEPGIAGIRADPVQPVHQAGKKSTSDTAWLTTREVAAELGLTVSQVWRRVRFGRLPSITFGYTDPENRRGATVRFDAAAVRQRGRVEVPARWSEAPATAEELAAWLRVDPKTIRRALDLGQLHSARPAAATRAPHVFRRREVMAFIADHSNV